MRKANNHQHEKKANSINELRKRNGVKRVSPMFNDVFLRVFGGQDSKEATRSLINSIFRETGIPEIDEIESIAAETGVIGDNVTCKSGRADVVLVSDDRVVDLEAQGYHDSIENKALFYASKLLTGYTHKSDSYDELPQVIVVILLEGRKLLPGDGRVVTVGRLGWETSLTETLPMTDRVLFILAELEKVSEVYNRPEDVRGDEMLSWLYLLSEGYKDKREVESLMIEVPSIEEFAKLYGIAIDDPDIQEKYDLHHRQIMEANSVSKYLDRLEREAIEKGLEEGREEGLAEGRAEGLAEGLEQGRLESLRAAMSSLSISAERAIEVLGIPEQEKQSLLDKLYQ